MFWWDRDRCQKATSIQGIICSCFLVVVSVHLFFLFLAILSALCSWFKAILLVKAYTDKAFRELALCKSTLVASERSDFKILFLHSIYSIDDRFITYLLFPFYDNHRSKPFLAVIPWKSPEDRLNLSSEDKPDDQVKPLTPLTHPPPPKKKKFRTLFLWHDKIIS